MSSVHYPLGLIKRLTVTRNDRVLVDEFESGGSTTRNLWAAQSFKRTFKLDHAALSRTEFAWLKSFLTARSGRYDPFWIRDNIHRGGQAYVRLAKPVEETLNGSLLYDISLELEQTAPVRELVDIDELTTAAGTRPLFWFDANRQIGYPHLGTYYGLGGQYSSSAMELHDRAGNYDGQIIFGDPILRTHLTQQYGASNCQSLGNTSVPAFSLSKPAITILLLARHSTGFLSKGVLIAMGESATGKQVGIAMGTDDKYYPWINGTQTWTGVTNSPVDTYRTIACVWPASSDAATLYLNGSPTSAGSNSRTFGSGPINLGWSSLNTNSIDIDKSQLAHAMIFNAELSQAQIKAIHNLLAHQYSLSAV